MIDAPGRKEPRFPASIENAVRQRIKDEIRHIKNNSKLPLTGIAGGACGGDILFHEVCIEMDIPTEMHLALPYDSFIKKSVAFAGENWVSRFDRLYNSLPVYILHSQHLVSQPVDPVVWEECNLQMLRKALIYDGYNMILIALWNGKDGDGPGGTDQMVTEAQEKDAHVIIIDITMFLK